MLKSKKKRALRRGTPASNPKLRRENKLLRGTIDEVMRTVSEVPQTAGVDVAFNALEEISERIIAALPETYHRDEAEIEGAAIVEAPFSPWWSYMLGAEMGLDDEDFSQVKDINELLLAWRRVFSREFRVDLDLLPDGVAREQLYRWIVAHLFVKSVLFTAKIPCSLKGEAQNAILVLSQLKKGFEKRKRSPGVDVQTFCEMMEQGRSRYDIYPLAITKAFKEKGPGSGYDKPFEEMTAREKKFARRKLNHRVDSRERQRAKRQAPPNTSKS